MQIVHQYYSEISTFLVKKYLGWFLPRASLKHLAENYVKNLTSWRQKDTLMSCTSRLAASGVRWHSLAPVRHAEFPAGYARNSVPTFVRFSSVLPASDHSSSLLIKQKGYIHTIQCRYILQLKCNTNEDILILRSWPLCPGKLENALLAILRLPFWLL